MKKNKRPTMVDRDYGKNLLDCELLKSGDLVVCNNKYVTVGCTTVKNDFMYDGRNGKYTAMATNIISYKGLNGKVYYIALSSNKYMKIVMNKDGSFKFEFLTYKEFIRTEYAELNKRFDVDKSNLNIGGIRVSDITTDNIIFTYMDTGIIGDTLCIYEDELNDTKTKDIDEDDDDFEYYDDDEEEMLSDEIYKSLKDYINKICRVDSDGYASCRALYNKFMKDTEIDDNFEFDSFIRYIYKFIDECRDNNINFKIGRIASNPYLNQVICGLSFITKDDKNNARPNYHKSRKNSSMIKDKTYEEAQQILNKVFEDNHNAERADYANAIDISITSLLYHISKGHIYAPWKISIEEKGE